MADEGAGRSRGRARGRPAGPPGEGSPDQGAGDSPPVGGNGGAVRGRGGMRPGGPLNTIPQGITTTVGEDPQSANVKLMSNYIRIKAPSDVIVYQYRVDYEPEIEARVVRRGMLSDKKAIFGGAYIFDGGNDAMSTADLGPEPTVLACIRKTDQVPITITIKRTGEIPWGSNQMLRVYNTQMRRNLSHMKYMMVGRHFFNPNEGRMPLEKWKLEIWQGINTAVNIHDGGTLMVADSVHKIIRADTVYDVLHECLQKDRGNFKDAARKELADCIVLTQYNNKTYKIEDIEFDKNPTYEFDKKGTKTTMLEYYKTQYSINIKDSKQPLIKCKPSIKDRRGTEPSGPVLLIPELCAMTGLTESLKADFNLKKEMTQRTQLIPNKRIGELYKFLKTMTANEKVKEDMDAWKLSYEDNLVTFPGRTLPCERIIMQGEPDTQGGGSTFNQVSGDFSKEIRGKKMRVPISINAWTIICTQRDKQVVEKFSSTLNKVCGPLGVVLQRPTVTALENDRVGTFMEACKRIRDQQMVVVIVPNNNKDRYDTIKKVFCCEQPVASQVVVFRTLSKEQMMMSVCTKVGIQMACKLGAEAWGVRVPPKTLMVVGYDTHHDGTRKGQSAGGFVSSINPTLTRWYSRVAYHNNQEEMSNNFAANFEHGLKHYREVNGRLPERIIVYRDGVSEGQIPHVFDVELAQVRDAITKVAGTEPVKLSFIIVTKRVNSRFFALKGPKDAENPSPGTIVDNTVTRKERYDFYLIAQSVRAGTVGPVNFNIIEDESGWKPHHHQQLAYKLCHLYYNWMGTIKVPAPCQYAHKLAMLTGVSLHREPATALADTLFYL